MKREMLREDCRMSAEEAKDYLKKENWGVLSLCGDDGFPYGVPMNYVWDEGTILLHCTAKKSHRLDALRKDAKVCFTVVPEHRLDPENRTCLYASVIVFGMAEILTEKEEKIAAMKAFMRALAPQSIAPAFSACDPGSDSLAMIRIRPVYMTGKKNS